MNPLDYPICLHKARRTSPTSSWLGHIPFAMALVDAVRPRRLVELGTMTGESYCAFCQAVDTLGIGGSIECFAVDTWRGDYQSGEYGQQVMDDLQHHHDLFYASFSTLIQSTFDDALHRFDEGSIDLLHIDGLHTYEAVRHDFETWESKLSDRAVVLFHDTMVKDRDFGVWKFWKELSPKYPHFSFHHSAGLGVLAVGESQPDIIRSLCGLSEDDQTKIRTFFQTLANRESSGPHQFTELLRNTISELFNIEPGTADMLLVVGYIMLSINEPEVARRLFRRIAIAEPNNLRFQHALKQSTGMLTSQSPSSNSGQAA